ncbi:MAG: M42 family metallopeptidase [Ezakiella sp.]|uniref:M42 family metallopeptidase n=1 Tax=Ezakiella sp. TaxID=1935205 RepID=UPI00297B3AC5|nr:M42 family metallopeptidase [Ezakiella sp.]MDD7731586.1 M42 family metallopeptidase [Eubacteriales bacterium]MDY6079645.1 M42 family metallopeptidase [Ezakiella sp.]
MAFKYDLDYIINFGIELLKTPSPTGDTKKAVKFVKDELEKYYPCEYTRKGALLCKIEGENKDDALLLSAHVDTLGAMVKELKPNGRLKMSMLGGYSWATVEGLEVTIPTEDGKEYTGTIMTTAASSHVNGGLTQSIERNDKNLEIRVDEVVKSKEDLEKLGIQVGDFVYYNTGTRLCNSGYLKSRHLDDKACVMTLVGIAKYMKENNIVPPRTTYLFISNYEEVGHGSSAGVPKEVTEFISVDMAAPGPGQTSDEQKTTICVKDSTGPYDIDMKRKLIKLAKENDIPYVLDIYPFYGSDASAAQRAGVDVRAALIGPGVDASHSFERTHKDGIKATTDLAIAYVLAK